MSVKPIPVFQPTEYYYAKYKGPKREWDSMCMHYHFWTSEKEPPEFEFNRFHASTKFDGSKKERRLIKKGKYPVIKVRKISSCLLNQLDYREMTKNQRKRRRQRIFRETRK